VKIPFIIFALMVVFSAFADFINVGDTAAVDARAKVESYRRISSHVIQVK
jgi:hypothetical protein